jgi:hypothetical protein
MCILLPEGARGESGRPPLAPSQVETYHRRVVHDATKGAWGSRNCVGVGGFSRPSARLA